jgi:hypothetical protein
VKEGGYPENHDPELIKLVTSPHAVSCTSSITGIETTVSKGKLV